MIKEKKEEIKKVKCTHEKPNVPFEDEKWMCHEFIKKIPDIVEVKPETCLRCKFGVEKTETCKKEL